MRARCPRRRWYALPLALALAGCGGSGGRVSTGSGGHGGVGDATQACLEAPSDVLRPPPVELPCELIPPGVRLR